MGLYQRKPSKVWYVDITKPDGTRYRSSTNTENKQLAKEFHDKLKRDLWEQSKLGVKPSRTLKEATEMFLNEKRTKKTIAELEHFMGWWLEQFGEKALLTDVTQERIIEVIEAKRKSGVSPSTCNRYLAPLRACLRLATLKYQWLDKNQLPTFFMYKEPKGRVRWLTPADMTRFIEACPAHLKPVALFSLATGLRRSNVIRLRWSQVDMQRQCIHIDGDEMKGGKDIAIPLSAEAMSVVTQQIGKHHEFVFTFRGRPFKVISSDTWKLIIEKAGLEDFRWHDLRHCWATAMVRGGVPLHVIQVLGAWKSEKMVLRYGHQNTDSLKPYTEVAGKVVRDVTSQFRHQTSVFDTEEARLRAV